MLAKHEEVVPWTTCQKILIVKVSTSISYWCVSMPGAKVNIPSWKLDITSMAWIQGIGDGVHCSFVLARVYKKVFCAGYTSSGWKRYEAYVRGGLCVCPYRMAFALTYRERPVKI